MKKIIFGVGVLAAMLAPALFARADDSISMGVQTQAGTITNICIAFSQGAAANVTVNGAQMGHYDVGGANTERCFDTTISFHSGDDVETVSANGPYVQFLSATGTLVAPTYTLTYTAGANGTLTGSTTQSVESGANGSAVEAVPNAGYHFTEWSDMSVANPRIDDDVLGDITVSAEFSTTTAPAAPVGAPIAFPTSTGNSFLAFVGGQVADPGLLLVVVIAAAVPLTFYVIKQLIQLIP
jgi:hypothetical protein